MDAKLHTHDTPYNTNINVKAGDLYSFKVTSTDKWSWNKGDFCNANGGKDVVTFPVEKFFHTNSKNEKMPYKFYVGSLLAKVNDKFIFTGVGPMFVNFTHSGKLQLLFWDSYHGDNSGKVTVEIKKIDNPISSMNYEGNPSMRILEFPEHKGSPDPNNAKNCFRYSPNIWVKCFTNLLDERITSNEKAKQLVNKYMYLIISTKSIIICYILNSRRRHMESILPPLHVH